MSLLVRMLLKVPSVRRVIARRVNVEAAIADLQAHLGVLGAQLTDQKARLGTVDEKIASWTDGLGGLSSSANTKLAHLTDALRSLREDQNLQRMMLDTISEHMPPERRAALESQVHSLNTIVQQQQSLVAEVAEHMPPERRTALEGQVHALNAIVHQHQSLIVEVADHMPPERRAALESQVHSLNAIVQQQQSLIAEVAEHMPPERRTALEGQVHALNVMTQALQARIDRLVAEASGWRMPPEQREALEAQARAVNEMAADKANLEATLHGQQLQLGAINSAVFANQMNLSELNAAVEKLSTTVTEISGSQATAVGDLDRENRLLRVGHGATFEELIAAGKLPTANAYRFEELLVFRDSKQPIPTVPPLVFIHVPKAGGTTTNNILMKNYKYRADSYGVYFFPRYFPTEFAALVQSPSVDDDRMRPAFFTGHIGLDNEIFRRMPVRYVVATVLREPVSRIISHYRFHSSEPSVFRTAIIDEGLDIIEYSERFRSAIPLQCEYFTAGKDNSSGSGDGQGQVDEALRNLESKVSLFGVLEEFDAFAVLLAELLGLSDTSYRPLNQTLAASATVTPKQIGKLRELLTPDIAFYDAAVKLYRKRRVSLPFNIDTEVKAFRIEQKTYARRRSTVAHQWASYYS